MIRLNIAAAKFLALLIALCLLLCPLLHGPTTKAQDPPPIAGPGWHTGIGEPVTPTEARRVLFGRSRVGTVRVAALPATETEATTEIQALARALENDPRLIFDYVHNHIEYVPTFGSAKGATATLLAGRGNDWDQTSLFIALMRAAGYTANYVVGDVTYPPDRLANWAGVSKANVFEVFVDGGVPIQSVAGGYRITRAWATATIGGKSYVFDPAMKEYTTVNGVDIPSASGYDRATFMSHARHGATVTGDSVQYMNEANVRADLITYTMNLVNYIKSNMPDATLAEVIGGREIASTTMTQYPTSLPYALDVVNETTYATLPAAYRHTLRVEHLGIDHTFYTFQIAGRRVSIFYDAANGNRPVLRVDGETVATGDPASGGNDATLTIDHPYAAYGGTYADQQDTTSLRSDSSYVILHDLGTASADLVAGRSRLLDRYVHAGYADTSEPVQGEGLWLMGLAYAYEKHLFTRLLARVGQVVTLPHHLVGWMAQEAGYLIDLPMEYNSYIRTGASSAPTWAMSRALAMFGSALEHGALEQMQGSDREAISAVKAIQMNNAAGAKTFLADSSNWALVKPQLQNYSSVALSDVESLINDGNTCVLPENGWMALNDWHGTGYIGYNGSTAMVISGGWYGGSGSWIVDILIEAVLKTLQEFDAPPDQKQETRTFKSGDPVDMTTGAFHLESRDLVVGGPPLDLHFARSYHSGSHYSRGPLGYGWSHNHQLTLTVHDDYAPGLGQRQPTDAAALIVYAHVILDVLEHEVNLQGWVTADLATKWAMDQLIDGAVTVHLRDTSVEYIRLPDGTYNPPPGLRLELVKRGDYYYAQGAGNTCTILDADGRARVWLDANGNALIYTYDNDGKLQTVGNPTLGLTLTFAYSGTLLTSVGDQAGRAVAFEYTDGELTTFRDAEGNVWQYAYDADHRLLSVTRPRGNTVVTNVYDNLGRIKSQTDALGNTTTFYFGGFRNVELAPDGSRTTYYLDDRGRLTAREDALGKRTLMTYDGQYHLRSLTNRLGDVTTYTYDPASGQIATITDAEGGVSSYTYISQSTTFTNPLNGESVTLTVYNLTRKGYPDGTYETYTYDAHGNRTARTDQAGHTWTFQYNARGQLTQVVNPAGGRAEYTYNADGTLASSTDSDLGVTTYEYDQYRRLIRIVHPDGSSRGTTYDLNDRVTSLTDERGNAYTYEYDANGNLTRSVDPGGAETLYAYDAMDNLIRVTDALGNVTLTTYDARGRPSSTTDPNGNATTYGYDPRGWQNSVTDPLGKAQLTDYDDEGLVAATQTPMGHAITIERDALGQIVATEDPLHNTSTLRRDELGRVTEITDPLGRATRHTYDERGLLTGVILPGGAAATYDYDGLGLLTTIRDPRGNEWRFTYTPMGRRQSHTDPLGNQWTYSYNPRGSLTQVTYPDGSTETRTYDAAGNLIRRQFSTGLDLKFTYDELGRFLSTEGLGLSYDKMGRVTDTQTLSVSFGAAYDGGGRLKAVTYANGTFTVTYEWDARDLLTRVTDGLSGAEITFTYDDDGRLLKMQRSNGIDALLTWDAASRLTRIRDGTLIDLQYGYDAAGQVVSQTYLLPLDPANYLDGGVPDLTYDAASQISSPGYAYDALGRLIADPERAYTWDGASRLVGIAPATGSGPTVTLAYNGNGDLLTRTEGGRTIGYYYNYALKLTPITAERDESTGQFLRYYVWTPDGKLLYMIDAADGNQVYFYHFDQAGSTLALSDENGDLTDAYAYDPYGRLLYHQGDSEQPFTFIGRWGVRREGSDGSLYHVRARYYDATTTRFISRDPVWPELADPRQLNPYHYAAQNPLVYVDPTGESIWGYVFGMGMEMLPSLLKSMEETAAKFAPPSGQSERRGQQIADDLRGMGQVGQEMFKTLYNLHAAGMLSAWNTLTDMLDRMAESWSTQEEGGEEAPPKATIKTTMSWNETPTGGDVALDLVRQTVTQVTRTPYGDTGEYIKATGQALATGYTIARRNRELAKKLGLDPKLVPGGFFHWPP